MAESPGSVNEFARRVGIDPKDALSRFTVALAAYKCAQELQAKASANKTTEPSAAEEGETA
jgi:hypothetical protein